MESFVVLGILLIIVGAAVRYIYKEKKKGVRCIGCPAAGCCSAKKGLKHGEKLTCPGK